ncbi:aldehyde dehydrogenase YcbD [Rhodococcus opacus M213]|uniref:Aldehyde dehydrogenase YcbD n=1 Tax=Rhodococcus opacus M213 TaxID=1129896 RepID=K8XLM8_RHOOP|nr:aldehyde dehydrogenase family protein [Rhodococcus opacus]EKT81741.1 aldehyde dehydrogenase YcbD [Rhodococcus opacus M213]
MSEIIAHHLVAGHWEQPHGTREVHPSPVPTRVGTIVGDATSEQVCRALHAASAAQHDWSTVPPAIRAASLADAADRLAGAIDEITPELSREVGKTLAESRGEIDNAVKLLRFYAGSALRPEGKQFPTGRHSTLAVASRRPRGVVLVISPWNFPVNLTVLKLAPALAMGNAVIVKPSPMAGRTTELLLRALAPALPSGLVALLHGGSVVGEMLVDADEVAAVSFTGSTGVGRAIGHRVATRGIPYLAEMGGKNVLYADRGADLEATLDAALGGAFAMAGQKCTATSLLMVHADIASAITCRLRDRAMQPSFRVGDPFAETTVIGAMVSAAATDRVAAIVAEATDSGAEPVWFAGTGDSPEPTYPRPVALLNPPDHVRAYRDEVFGPVLSVVPVPDLDHAVSRINRLGYGLVSSIYTDDLSAAMSFSSRVRTGTVMVNQPTTGLDHNVPFVGWGDSGLGGLEQSDAALDFYTNTKTTYLSW